jgi:hypothetical protein
VSATWRQSVSLIDQRSQGARHDKSLHQIGFVAGWEIKGNHEACLGQHYYAETGTTLAFVSYVSGRSSIYIQNGNWNIPAGVYLVTVQVDRRPPSTFQTTFYAPERALVLNWNMTADEIDAISFGTVFSAKIGSVNYQYSLAGSAQMLQAMLKCVSDLNPYSGVRERTPSNPFPETPSNPYRRM